ncbi:hypothetical protein EDD86DRAFT_196290 [Gorgonomyces haynaldii]|nr:hypothetical protein EDD86DRAFT_196290 [Gorgonomyces haynaldii]
MQHKSVSIILQPPLEEAHSEPCLVVDPEPLVGIDNPHEIPSKSMLNSVLQIYLNLPNITEELPVAPQGDLSQLVLWMRSVWQGNSSALDWEPLEYQELLDRLTRLFCETRFGDRYLFEIKNTTISTNRYLTVKIGHLPQHNQVTLLSVLNQSLGHHYATFFDGNSLPLSSSGPKTTFLKLPELLCIYLERPLSESGYHSTPVEIPIELDAGLYLDPSARKPVSHGVQCTFYRLHGFSTQAQGKFVTYTRIRGGSEWYRCCDEATSVVDLGMRVSSKGVLFCVYRLQIK